MKELWKKYTRTRTQRGWVSFIAISLLVVFLSAIFIPPIFVLIFWMLIIFVPPFLLAISVQWWVQKGERY